MTCKSSYVFSSKLVNCIFPSLPSDSERYSSLTTLQFFGYSRKIFSLDIRSARGVSSVTLNWNGGFEMHKFKMGIWIYYLLVVCFVKNMGWETPYLYKYLVTLDLRNFIMSSSYFLEMHLRLNPDFLWKNVFTNMHIWKVPWCV